MARTAHRRGLKLGLGILTLGLTIGSTGLATLTAQAAENDHQITVCHVEGNGSYSSPSPTKAAISDPNGHGAHSLDVIPPFPAGSQGRQSWDAYPGLNWDAAGRALYDTCAPCPTGSHDELGGCTVSPVDVCPDVDGVQTDVSACPAGGDDEGSVDEGPVDVCPDVDGVQTDVSACPAELIDAVVVERVPVKVLGVQLRGTPAAATAPAGSTTASLPRTGRDIVALLELAAALLLGGGLMVTGARRRLALATAR